LLGLVILGCLAGLAFFPQLIAPYDPTELAGRPLEPPSTRFWLGTNDIGQDLFSELVWGARVSLSTGLVVAALAVALGTLVGLLAGYLSGPLPALLLRLVDLTLVLPFLPLVILLSAYLGPGQRNVILVLALVSWAAPARIIRSRVLSISSDGYVEAARALGGTSWHILRKHMLPGVGAIVLVQFILVASSSILAETSLSFLGLGNPATKSWGSMLYFARASGAFLGDAWRWWVLPAGLMISLSVFGLVLVGYALEQWLEPGPHQ
jgi:ABC-type dipeptide/oligopeptide/nickel transport system permease subunit